LALASPDVGALGGAFSFLELSVITLFSLNLTFCQTAKGAEVLDFPIANGHLRK
jgi:hypothetical protein